MAWLNWLGIMFCLTQSAIFSGLNLAFFSIPRLRLEIEAGHGNREAQKVLKMRRDSNFLLTTILWGNVGINVLLTLLSNSVMAGAAAFLFSTVLITFFGEIIPQAYFSRHALKMASFLTPVLKIYQFILYIVAKPSAKLLDGWLGEESIQYFKEKSLKQLIRRHIEESHEIDLVEGIGAINFLSIDDLLVGEEGGPLHPESIISLPVKSGKPVYPLIKKSIDDSFLLILNKSKQKWVVILDERQKPAFVVDADGFIRGALFDTATFNPDEYTHRPIVVSNSSIPLGEVLKRFETKTADHEDDVITNDVIVVWGKKKQIITGADILGRLMRGIIKGHDPDHLDRSTA
jgi:metal transporter CNNM